MSISKPLIILFKFFCVLVGFLLALVLLVLLGLNLFKFGYYNEYFSLLSKEAKNPGLSENFVPQGITHCDNLFVTVGYMADDTNSRIYTVDYITGEVKHFPLISDGRSFVGHTGGIQYSNGYFYLANEGEYPLCPRCMRG